MGYRDDETALRLRVAELEERLALAEGELARLRGEAAPAEGLPVDWMTGEPVALVLERRWHGRVGGEAREAVARLLDARDPAGRTEVVGEGLLHRGLGYALMLRSEKEETTLRLVRRRGAARWRVVVGAAVASVLAVPTVGVLVATLGLGPFVFGTSALMVMVACAALIRSLVRRDLRDERRRLASLFEVGCDHVHRTLLARSGARMRVVADDDGGHAEAEAEEEAQMFYAARAG